MLAERFREIPAFVALYDAAVERLQGELFDDGTAQEVLDAWTSVLTEQAGDLVDEATIETEAAQIEAYFDGQAVEIADEMP